MSEVWTQGAKLEMTALKPSRELPKTSQHIPLEGSWRAEVSVAEGQDGCYEPIPPDGSRRHGFSPESLVRAVDLNQLPCIQATQLYQASSKNE
ncbi:hypothetical protein PGT21_003635 [Puccinia graminis f. sp. tritici]|uniref:Uncharacterized protein n=1 Tax=Puccinia graminis f. sp. tritici TaxID=56615 RepID=A0A5B0MGK1_PUCGR|nr:hypothetical protein PGT21_003635 [Puccinia graminis f. sp. tritici]KAA1135602.1 hypothetical protein PGTUg99_025193 [Puccinia graminis f. sp. tritici]